MTAQQELVRTIVLAMSKLLQSVRVQFAEHTHVLCRFDASNAAHALHAEEQQPPDVLALVCCA